MKLSILIRPAQIQDSLSLAQIQVDSYRASYAGILSQAYLDHFTYEEQTQDWHAWFSQAQHELLSVAESNTGELVGYALGQLGPTKLAPYDSELVALHVRRPYQRQGLGRQLVGAMAERLRQQNCSSLMLWVLTQNSARSFYERLGGQCIGQQQIQLGDDELAVEVAYGWPDIASLAKL